MGGFGSGRKRSYGTGTVVEDCVRLDMASLRKELAELQDSRFTGIGSAGTEVEYDVWKRSPHNFVVNLRVPGTRFGLDHTPSDCSRLQVTVPRFGGRRFWFVCPRCARRSRVLYLPPYSRSFACRVCHGLSYRSQHEDQSSRLIAKIGRLKARLGAQGRETAAAAPTPLRPHRMRWITYFRLVSQLRTVEERFYKGLQEQLESLKRRSGACI